MDLLELARKGMKNIVKRKEAAEDPKALELWAQYVRSERLYRRQVNMAIRAMKNQEKPGPRRPIKFEPLHAARRIFEKDARKYFGYRPNISQPPPPDTAKRQAKEDLKRAEIAQLLGEENQALKDLENASSRAEKQCKNLLKQIKNRREIDQGTKQAMVDAVIMANELGASGSGATKLSRKVSELIRIGAMRDVRSKPR